MTFDEYETRLVEIKKKGLNIYVENDQIGELREKYYEKKLTHDLDFMSNRFKKNVLFLNRLHGYNITAAEVREFMGLKVPHDFNKVLYQDYKLFTFRVAFITSEFFGLPMELLLFHDLEINEEGLRHQYPALFKQSRH